MTDLTERKQKANRLRKEGDFEGALLLYRDLWKEVPDKFDAAGFLHCLRKLKLFDEALPLAGELIVKYPDFKWCRNEVVWTYIQGTLDKLDEDEPVKKVVEIARRIMSLNPEDLAAKMVVFKVLKSAKSSNQWQTVNEWVVRIDPNSLSTEPITDGSGRGGWSDQSLWYNYRINGLIETGDAQEAISTVDEILERFPKQRRFFLRLKALANHILGNLPESEVIYQDLCGSYEPDWWILYEYAKVIRDEDRKEDALKVMFQAASGHSKLESMVSLFADIGMLCKELGRYEEARAHLVLCRYIRSEKEWTIPEHIIDALDELNKVIGNDNEPSSLREAVSVCRSTWSKLLCRGSGSRGLSFRDRKARKGLVGKVSLGRSDRPFCFIVGDSGESVFCYKSDLPPDTAEGGQLTFDAIPSFDKKKNKESWKASNVRRRA